MFLPPNAVSSARRVLISIVVEDTLKTLCCMGSFAGPITLQTALARHADLLSPVSKQSVATFAAFAEGEDKEKLLDILTGNGGANYKEWHGSSKCLLELMEEFPDVKPPLGRFFELDCLNFHS